MAGIRDIASIVTFSTLQLVFLNRSGRLCWGPDMEETSRKGMSKNVTRPNSFKGILTGTAVNDSGEFRRLGKGHIPVKPP